MIYYDTKPVFARDRGDDIEIGVHEKVGSVSVIARVGDYGVALDRLILAKLALEAKIREAVAACPI
jgi:hypothetical protein